MIKARKIDRRNPLHGVFDYQIKISFPKFFEIRNWCWDQYGPGIEYEHYVNYHAVTSETFPWAWDSSRYHGASRSFGNIYLSNDQLTYFWLKWKENE